MRLLKLLTVALFATMIAGKAWAEEIELKFGHVGAPGSLFEASANEFAKRANEKLAGKAKVVTFGSSQLGKDKELLQKLKLGTVDFALPSTVMSTVADEFGLFEMPYLVKDRDHMGRIEEDIFWEKIAPAAEDKGYKILAVWENGFRHITNNIRPIVKPEDLKGIKLRTPGSKTRILSFEMLGATPIKMNVGDIYLALQQGVIDGQENPFGNIRKWSWFEVQKYISISRHVYTPITFVMNLERYNSLST